MWALDSNLSWCLPVSVCIALYAMHSLMPTTVRGHLSDHPRRSPCRCRTRRSPCPRCHGETMPAKCGTLKPTGYPTSIPRVTGWVWGNVMESHFVSSSNCSSCACSSSVSSCAHSLPAHTRARSLPAHSRACIRQRTPEPAPRHRPPVPAPSERPPVPAPSERPLLPAPPERPPVPAPPEPAPPERPPEPSPPERKRPQYFFFGGVATWITIVAVVKTLDEAIMAPLSRTSQTNIWPWLPESPVPSWLPESPDPLWPPESPVSLWPPESPVPPWLPEPPDPPWMLSQWPCPAPASRAPTHPPRCYCYSAGRAFREWEVMSRICLSFLHSQCTSLHLNLHWAHLHLIQTSSPPLLKHTPHCTPVSDLVCLHCMEAIIRMWTLFSYEPLTFWRITYLLCPRLCPLQYTPSSSVISSQPTSRSSKCEVCVSFVFHEFLYCEDFTINTHSLHWLIIWNVLPTCFSPFTAFQSIN